MGYFGNYQPGITWVNRDQEVLNYLMLPNQFMTFRNNNGKTVYFKQTDASGRATCEAYDLVPHNQTAPEAALAAPQGKEEYITRKEFDEFVRRMKAAQNREEVKEDE